MNELSIRVTAADMASNVLASLGDNVRSLGQTATNAFDSMISSGRDASQSVSEAGQSSTILVGGLNGIRSLAGALFSVSGGAVAAVGGVAAVGIAVTKAAEKSRREIDNIGNTFKLIEAQRLNIDIGMVGQESIAGVTSKVKSLADALETATGKNSSKFMSLGKDALMLGVDPKKIDEVIKSATGLSYAFGTSLEDGLSKSQQAMKGNFDSFKALIPGIESMATSEQKLAAVNKLATDSMKMQIQTADESISIFSRLSMGFGNLLERVGTGQPAFETFSGVLVDMVFPAIDMFDRKIFDLGDSADSLKDTFKNSMAYIATVVDLYSDQASLSYQRMTLQFNLATETAINRAKSMVDNIPSYAEYLNNVLSKYTTLLKNGSIWDSIRSLSDMTPGEFFIKNNELMPDALKKNPGKTVFERQLEDMLRKINEGANREFDSMLKQNLDKIESVISQGRQTFSPALTLDPKKLEQPLIAVDTKINQAYESRVQLRGPVENIMERGLVMQERQVAALERIEQKLVANEAQKLMQISNSGFLEVKLIE